MAVSNFGRFGIALVAIVVALPPSFGRALRGAATSGNDTAITFVHDLLQAAYPDIFGKSKFLTLSVGQPIDDSWRKLFRFRFEVTPFDPQATFNPTFEQHTGKRIPPPSNAPLMAGSFWFDRDGHLFQMWAGESDITRSKQNDEFEKFIQSHPEWPDARDYQELKKAGALYGPGDKEDFARAIHLERFEKVLGHIEIKSIEFSGPVNEEHEGDFATFDWSVRVAVRRPDGSSGTYALVFEPFGGRLTSIYRTDHPRH